MGSLHLRQDLDERRKTKHTLQALRPEYDRCMSRIYNWRQKYQISAGAEFKKQVASTPLVPEAEGIAECLSLTKDFWERYLHYIETYGAVETNRSRLLLKHQQFVERVRPLEVLSEHGQDTENGIYVLTPKLKAYLHI